MTLTDINLDLCTTNHFLHFKSFMDLTLTPGEALAILRNFEERTGQNADPFLLKPEEFAKLLEPEDYNITPEVSFAIFKPYSGLVP